MFEIQKFDRDKKTPIKKLFFTLDPCWGRWIPRGACNETPIGEKVLPARAAVQLDNGDIFLKVSHDWILQEKIRQDSNLERSEKSSIEVESEKVGRFYQRQEVQEPLTAEIE